MSEFIPFPKIPRYNRLVTITEKIDGTNGVVAIVSAAEDESRPKAVSIRGSDNFIYNVYAGSRNRWVTPEDDNYGFAKWVYANAQELLALGVGQHHGEWWGSGIQRGYGLKNGEKRFSLFNTTRWMDKTESTIRSYPSGDPRKEPRIPVLPPACCSVVPVLWEGMMEDIPSITTMGRLKSHGSYAAPGFMNPEGIVIHHHASGHLYKRTCENDAGHKG